MIVFALSRVQGRSPVLMVVLAGVIAGALFSALTSLIKYVADPYDKLPAIVVWLMGSFATTTYRTLVITTVPIVAASLFLYLIRFRLNIVSLGEEEAQAMGINTDRLRWSILTAVIGGDRGHRLGGGDRWLDRAGRAAYRAHGGGA